MVQIPPNPTNYVSNYTQFMNSVMQDTNLTGLLGMQSAQDTARYSYLTALTEAQGQRKQLAINEYATRANTHLDLQNLALSTNYGLMNKQLEMYTIDAQVREKLMGTFFELEKGKLDNTFQRSKSIVQSVKY